MNYSSKIDRAIKKAAVLHDNQFRKSLEKTPYIIHPFAVALLLSNYTEDEEIIIAALLHDTVEDTDYTFEEMEKDFGKRVKDIVEGVTEPKIDFEGKKLPWKERKSAYLLNLAKHGEESLLLSAGDKICNMRDQIEDYKKFGEKLWENYNSTPTERFEYHLAVLNILKEKLENPAIIAEYEKLLEETKSFSCVSA